MHIITSGYGDMLRRQPAVRLLVYLGSTSAPTNDYTLC